MNKVDKGSVVFIFMLKEYEMLYAAFDRHSKAVEKSITFFWIFIGAMVSLQGLIYKQATELALFNLTSIQLLLLSIIVILGGITAVNIIEHRLLYIAYVKSINLTRKWFVDHSEDENVEKYLFFEASVKSPTYFKERRHFYWETLGVLLIESMLFSLLITNISARYLQFSPSGTLWLFIRLGGTLLLLGMCCYQKMLSMRDERLKNELDENGLIEKRMI